MRRVQWYTPSRSNWSDVKHYQLLALGNRSLTERREGGLHAVAAGPIPRPRRRRERVRRRGHVSRTGPGCQGELPILSWVRAPSTVASVVIALRHAGDGPTERSTVDSGAPSQTSLPSPNAEDREVSDVVVDVAKEVLGVANADCSLFSQQTTPCCCQLVERDRDGAQRSSPPGGTRADERVSLSKGAPFIRARADPIAVAPERFRPFSTATAGRRGA